MQQMSTGRDPKRTMVWVSLALLAALAVYVLAVTLLVLP